ncbi:MAG: acylase [Candidatus Omnitrophica bacterium]|nr:acylase [Candidatus Omnitrophota bacterium]
MVRKLLAALVLVVLSLLVFAALPNGPSSQSLIERAKKHDARILRDNWGVPHIFGKRDSDVGYGLGFAHAEDDFDTLQEGVFLVRGTLAAVKGKEEAPTDYIVRLLRVWDLIEARYTTDLSPEIRAVCEAYADGLNHFAALHRDRVLPGLLPITGKDVVAGFVFKGPFFFGLDNRIRELFGSERRHPVSRKTTARGFGSPLTNGIPPGSNAFAVAPKRTPDGKTHLAINSHQPWEGPVAWYEAHLHSEEGWDATGGVFPGTPVILLGHNRDLGWAHTVNSPDLIDIYVLEMNPDNPNQYRFDGEWKDLEVREVGIRVRLWGPFFWTVKRETLWSLYGPTVRQEHGVYSIRYAGMDEIRQVEQWHRMNKARNFEEWQEALKMRAILSFNCVYADKTGTVYYLYNARLPIRAEGYDWEEYLPGDTSETLWTEYLPFEKLPQVLNPQSGFVVSCNNSPFRVSAEGDSPREEDFSKTLGIETHMTNRSLRALELFGGDISITEEEFLAYKFDDAYSKDSEVARAREALVEAPPTDDPLIEEGTELLRKWDLRTNAENTSTAIALLSIHPNPDGGHNGGDVQGMRENMVKYGSILKENFGRLDVPWGEVNRLIRGDVDLPLDGAADTLRATYSLIIRGGSLLGFEKGRAQARGGDSSMFMVTWDSEGKMTSRAIHQFGSATLDPNSPHYDDQAPLFARKEFRPVLLDETEIRAHLEREYRPGE